MRFKTADFVTLGPDHSHRRTLLQLVVRSSRVRKTIDAMHTEGHDVANRSQAKLNQKALKMAKTIAGFDLQHHPRFFDFSDLVLAANL